MEFEWDEAKNRSNFAKHGITFNEAMSIFKGLTLSKIDNRKDYGETRTISMGILEQEVVVVVVHTDRNGQIHLISARSANRMERKEYDDHCSKIT